MPEASEYAACRSAPLYPFSPTSFSLPQLTYQLSGLSCNIVSVVVVVVAEFGIYQSLSPTSSVSMWVTDMPLWNNKLAEIETKQGGGVTCLAQTDFASFGSMNAA